MSDTTGVQEHWTEDDDEVMAAAKALAAYYDGDDDEAENWIAGAVVALNATNYRGGRGRADALEAALRDLLAHPRSARASLGAWNALGPKEFARHIARGCRP